MTDWLRTRIVLACAVATLPLLTGSVSLAQGAVPTARGATSPALCGPGDIREPGIQGEVPAGQTALYNCGVRLLGQLPRVGQVQGYGKCAYLRSGGTGEGSGRGANTVYVIDVRNPAKPLEVGSFPVKSASETMRVAVAADRAILVSGSSVYDIRNCLRPVHLGEIKWPPLARGLAPPSGGGGGTGLLPHDLRINHAGTKVYGSLGLWEADITNLRDPESWKITDHRCSLAVDVPGPWQGVHREAERIGMSLCADLANPKGANYRIGSSGLHAVLLWPTLSHGISVSGDDTRVFLGDQAGGTGGRIANGKPKLRVVDVSGSQAKLLGATDGPGHSTDWFTVRGREYVLHANEGGSAGIGPDKGGDTCQPHPRPTALGWAFDAIVTDVTEPTAPRNFSRLALAINEPENCERRKASGSDPWVAYHFVDNPREAKFAAVNFNAAGLRIFDLRRPEAPVEVAYFNHGPLVHSGVGHFDAARGLIYAAGNGGFWVLELEPQVRRRLGL